MKRVTVSTKVAKDVVKRITDSGFRISDSLQVGLRLFLDTPEDRKWSLILEQMSQKKTERARAKLQPRRLEEDEDNIERGGRHDS